MLPRLALIVMIAVPCSLYGQKDSSYLPETRGHFMAESVADLLSKEPEVRSRVDACKHDSHKADCDSLLRALMGKRVSFSNSTWTDFVVDGGKLVKLQTLVHEDFDAINAHLTNKFGPRTSQAVFPMQNVFGQKWEDHLYIWDTPTLFVRLHEDNNPASQNHHFVLVIALRTENEQEF